MGLALLPGQRGPGGMPCLASLRSPWLSDRHAPGTPPGTLHGRPHSTMCTASGRPRPSGRRAVIQAMAPAALSFPGLLRLCTPPATHQGPHSGAAA